MRRSPYGLARFVLFFGVMWSVVEGQERRTINVYFDHPGLELGAQTRRDSSAFPVQVFPVTRLIRSRHPEQQALIELLHGPTKAEIDSGYSTNLDGFRLSSLSVSRGRAIVKLKGNLHLKGTLSGVRLRKQVESTLKQFPRVRSVILYVNGKRDFDSLK